MYCRRSDDFTDCSAAYSFDEPDAFDTKALVQCLQSLKVSLLSNLHTLAVTYIELHLFS